MTYGAAREYLGGDSRAFDLRNLGSADEDLRKFFGAEWADRRGRANLQRSAYKVLAGVAQASEAGSIRLLRSLFPDSRVVVLAETSSTVDIQQILTLTPDGYIVNLGSRDISLKALELGAERAHSDAFLKAT